MREREVGTKRKWLCFATHIEKHTRKRQRPRDVGSNVYDRKIFPRFRVLVLQRTYSLSRELDGRFDPFVGTPYESQSVLHAYIIRIHIIVTNLFVNSCECI